MNQETCFFCDDPVFQNERRAVGTGYGILPPGIHHRSCVLDFLNASNQDPAEVEL